MVDTHKTKGKSLLIILILLKLQARFREASYTVYESRKNEPNESSSVKQSRLSVILDQEIMFFYLK